MSEVGIPMLEFVFTRLIQLIQQLEIRILRKYTDVDQVAVLSPTWSGMNVIQHLTYLPTCLATGRPENFFTAPPRRKPGALIATKKSDCTWETLRNGSHFLLGHAQVSSCRSMSPFLLLTPQDNSFFYTISGVGLHRMSFH